MFMRKFSNLFKLLLLLIVSFQLSAQNGGTSLKKQIIDGRIEKEKGEVEYAVKVSKQEIEVIKTIAYNALLKHRKLQLLNKSSLFLKERCFAFDYECRKIYSMSIAYLKSSLIDSQKDMDELEKLFEESHNRLKKLEEKLAYLEKGVDIETFPSTGAAAIPELENLFACNSFNGWNTNRGIFVLPGTKTDLPVQVFVKDVIKINGSGSVMILEAGDYTLNISYVKTPDVTAGEIVPAGKKLFTGTAGNPIIPGSVLIFLVKKGKFINPNFMCR